MATYTTNLNLKKPDGTEDINIADINGNMDLLDAALGKVDGLAVNTTAFTSVASLVTWLAALENNTRAIVSINASLCGTFIGGGSTGLTLLVYKGASTSYYAAFGRDNAATGNIDMSNASVTIKWSSYYSTVTNTSSVFEDKTIASGTTTTAGSITLPPGEYMIIITARWQTNASGYRDLWISDSQNGGVINLAAENTVAPVSGITTRQQLPFLYKSDSQSTLYVVVKQNSGSSLTLNTRYSIARIR